MRKEKNLREVVTSTHDCSSVPSAISTGSGVGLALFMGPVCGSFDADSGVSVEIMLAYVGTVRSVTPEVAVRWSREANEAVSEPFVGGVIPSVCIASRVVGSSRVITAIKELAPLRSARERYCECVWTFVCQGLWLYCSRYGNKRSSEDTKASSLQYKFFQQRFRISPTWP